MDLEMKKIKKDYLHKILTASLNNRNYSTVVFQASFCLDEIKDIIVELRNEFHLDNVIFIDFDYGKIKLFYESNPSEKEIKRFIPKFSKPVGNMKIIYFNNDMTDFSYNYNGYYSKKYFNHLRYYNKEVFDRMKYISKDDEIVVSCPNKEWAECMLGNQERLQELWLKISKTLLNPDEEKKEIAERVERKNEFNRLGIRNLHFYTDLGTDFKISLNTHSIWRCEPNDINKTTNSFNYPSYEIYTSPNCYSAEGKIVLSKRARFYHDTIIENAAFVFSEGKLVSCSSNNKMFNSVALYNKLYKMDRIGEIALVSQYSPLASLGELYDSCLLDENTGCHFALGDCITECIDIEKEKIRENGAEYYCYNTSKYHTDLVFGNDSILVEAETKDKKKILIMENGNWKI